MTTNLQRKLFALGSLLGTLGLFNGCGGAEDEAYGGGDCVAEHEDNLIAPSPPSLNPPEITSASTNLATPGDVVTIGGRNFLSLIYPVIGVRFGSTTAPNAAIIGSISGTSIQVQVPQGSLSGPVYVMFRSTQTGIQGRATSPFSVTVTPATPTALTGYAFHWTKLQLEWTDNAIDETGYEVWMADPNWRLLGTLGANDHSEPIDQLQPDTSYQFRIRAVRGTVASPFSSIITVRTLALPTVDISGGPSPFFTSFGPRARLTNAYAFLDSNGDGIVDGARTSEPANVNAFYPNYECTSVPRILCQGNRFAAGANLIIMAELETWSTVVRPQFIAIHARLQGSTISVTGVVAGDLWQAQGAPGYANPMALGALATPAFSLSAQGGYISGWVNANVFMVDTAAQTYAAQVLFQFQGALPIFDE